MKQYLLYYENRRSYGVSKINEDIAIRWLKGSYEEADGTEIVSVVNYDISTDIYIPHYTYVIEKALKKTEEETAIELSTHHKKTENYTILLPANTKSVFF
jgi:hypothetical protein